MPTIYPSLIAGNLARIDDEIMLLEPHCKGFHLDVMDGHFVPNLGLSIDCIHQITDLTKRQLWVHLMVEKPEDYIDKLLLPAGSIVTFHLEATGQDEYLAKRLREKKLYPSIAINPKTNVEKIFPFLDDIYQVCVMTVEPGHSGQEFLKDCEAKIEPLVGYRATSNLDYRIAVDGGVNKDNIARLAQKGIDDFVVGSALFSAKDPVKVLEFLKLKVGEK